jgi:4-hydroxysphinganine ceramide fatty acyl 2-hydroxylase
MQPDKINNKGQARLFHSDGLEVMTKTHPVVIYCMYLPVIAFMLYYGALQNGMFPAKEALLFCAGILSWTLFEYLMHRFLFHLIADSSMGRRIVYVMHGVHHEYPRDKERLFMPPIPSLVLAVVIFFTMYVVAGRYAFSFFPGFLLGYLLYGSMHYAIHAFHPPRMLKALWRNHHLHHYKTPDKGFGVSTVLWDIIFGTVPSKDDTRHTDAGHHA